jgi:hypothetical protein
MDTLTEIDSTGLAAAKALDLAFAYAKRNRATFRDYADILYTHILEFFHPHKDKILEQLVTAAATPGAPIKTKIWAYSVTYRTDGEVAQISDMVDFSKRGCHTVLFDNDRPMSVDAIFRNSDLCWRLAFTFGSKFRVTFVREFTKMISSEYSSYNIGVYVHYHPNGLLPYAEEKLIAAYKGVCDRPLHVGTGVYMTPRF